MTSPSSLEARVAHVEGIVDEMRARMGSIEERLNRIEGRLQDLDVRMAQSARELDSRMQANFQWTVGILIGVLFPMWLTIILAVLVRT